MRPADNCRRAARGGRARAVARPLPRRAGLHRARRRTCVLGALRRGPADGPVAPDLDARALARVEGADRLPRPALPRGHVRPPGKREIGPTARSRALQRGRVRRGRARRDGCVRDRSGRDRLALARGAARVAAGHGAPRAGARGGVHRPVFPGQPGGRAALAHDGRPEHLGHVLQETPRGQGLAEVQRRPLAGGLSRLRRLVLPQVLQHAPFDQADRGRDRMGTRHRCADADREHTRRPRCACDPARSDRAGPARAMPGPGHLRDKRQDHGPGRRKGVGERHERRSAQRPRGRPPHASAQAGRGQPRAARVGRPGAGTQ